MRFLLFILISFLGMQCVWATHNRAGEITYRQISGLTYEFTITTYTKASSVEADRNELAIFWGDGNTSILPRTTEIYLSNDIKLNRYTGRHTYSGPFNYVVYVIDPNRIESIINIAGSINVPFYIEDTLRILDPLIYGFNNSPVLLNPPIDFGNVGQVFKHNPNAYDPDGDSLSYTLIPPKQGVGLDVPGYVSPDGIVPGPDNVLTIDNKTGELVWDAPQRQGIYNVAILISEFRNGQPIGTVVRDLQIIIQASNNRPPVLSGPDQICVVAGDTVDVVYTATDPDTRDRIKLTSNGSPYEVTINKAAFRPLTEGNPSSSQFYWATTCDHLRNTDYQIIVKAEDNAPVPLVDLKTVVIKVLAPAPENLQGDFDPATNTVTLSWSSPYKCGDFSKFRGFSVWRKKGCGFEQDTCTSGLIGKGYTKIGETTTYSFVDNDLTRGNNYSYVVVADFSDKSQIGMLYNKFQSLPSLEFCLELPQNLPVLYHVDVKETDENNGKIYIEWSRPEAVALDTIINPGPYRMRLSRANGLNGTDFQVVREVIANSYFNITDTSFVDSNLNTLSHAYNYQIEFFVRGDDYLGVSDKASSVFLSIVPSDGTLSLSWIAEVPWENYRYRIYKKDEQTGSFIFIDSTENTTYIDTNLSNDSTYCYKVEAIGQYYLEEYKRPLYNFSQELCANPKDTAAPCAPVLTVENYCTNEQLAKGEFINYLRWTLPGNCQDSSIHKYLVYYKTARDAQFVLLDSVIGLSNKTFDHTLDQTLSGCYVVTAVDQTGNESDFSNEFCVSDCPDYKLPNVFTPNGDGKNDLFTPIIPYSGVSRISLKIFNRVGNLVFETEDPDINWDGTDIKNNKALPTAVFYYVCEVYFNALDGEQKLEEPLSGYIHLIREK